ncbi:hypothetical protein FH5_05326 [Priestia endophytica]|nr:hypothetical protein FH5_05326 [Priestia endophytica]
MKQTNLKGSRICFKMAAVEGIHLENKFIYTWNVSPISPFNFLFSPF